MLKIEGARPRGSTNHPGPRWRSASCPKKPALGHGYEARIHRINIITNITIPRLKTSFFLDYSRVSFCSWFVVIGIIVFRLSGCLMHIPCAAQASLHSLRPRRSAAEPVLGAKLLSIAFSLLYSFLSKSQ